MKQFSIAVNNLKKSLTPIESHLKLRNFLVGYSLTLADVTLVVNLIVPLQTVLDQTFRKDTIPNLTRYAQLILEGRVFAEIVGQVTFCKKMIQPSPANINKQAINNQNEITPASTAASTPKKDN